MENEFNLKVFDKESFENDFDEKIDKEVTNKVYFTDFQYQEYGTFDDYESDITCINVIITLRDPRNWSFKVIGTIDAGFFTIDDVVVTNIEHNLDKDDVAEMLEDMRNMWQHYDKCYFDETLLNQEI